MSDADDKAAARARAKTAQIAFLTFALAGCAVGVLVLVRAIDTKPGWEGALTGVFGGLFVALLIVGAGAWAAMWLMRTPKPKVDNALKPGDPLHTSMGSLLDELEAARKGVVAKVNARAAWRVPLCIAGGIAVWVLGLFRGEESDPMDLVALVVVPGLGGYVWASLKLSNEYARLYKARVLPRLAAEFGDMAWRPAVAPDMDALRSERLFREFDSVTADDQLWGKHRGLETQITEVKLTKGSGDNEKTVFDGLLVEIDLPKRLSGVTAVVADEGALGNFRDRMLGNGRQRVGLEDPVFERVYEVYGSDQVEARALLHPAFMERMLALGQRPDFGRPLALAVGNQLTIALPKTSGRNLFETPSFQRPAASREALMRLRDDIQALLAAADAVIALDSPARASGVIS
jgi:hypothetical protein